MLVVVVGEGVLFLVCKGLFFECEVEVLCCISLGESNKEVVCIM